jgi:hypothetical protein
MAKRIFERLRDEHGYSGGYTAVKDHPRQHRVAWVGGMDALSPTRVRGYAMRT